MEKQQASRAPLMLEDDGTKSISEICNAHYGKITWMIPDILPLEGVTMIVGSPKSGKSLFILNIIVNYLMQDIILGFYPPSGCTKKILYLDLESSHRRIKSRVGKMLIGTKTFPPNLTFATDWPRFGAGGMSKMRARLELEHFDLVIFDTLGKIQAVRGATSAHSYSMDEQEIDRFVRICRDYNTSVILVHHTRKAKSDDWIDMVSGSHGISGTVDTLLYLYREKGQSNGLLHVTGRDVDEDTYSLGFNLGTNSWEMQGRSVDLSNPLSRARRDVYELLLNQGSCMTPAGIATQLGKTTGAIKMLLGNMLRDDQVVREGYGDYAARVKIL